MGWKLFERVLDADILIDFMSPLIRDRPRGFDSTSSMSPCAMRLDSSSPMLDRYARFRRGAQAPESAERGIALSRGTRETTNKVSRKGA